MTSQIKSHKENLTMITMKKEKGDVKKEKEDKIKK